MDWESVARRLAALQDWPLVVLDADDQILLFNEAFKKLLEVLGRSPVERFVSLAPPESRESLRYCLASARRGGLREGFIDIQGASALLRATVNCYSVGGLGGVLLVEFGATEWPLAGRPGTDDSYVVSLSARTAGQLRHASFPIALAEDNSPLPCYTARFGFSRPCIRCPVFARPDLAAWPRGGIALAPRGAFQLVQAQRGPDSTASVTSLCLSAPSLEGLMEARLGATKVSAGLSEREADVLKYLLMGRSLGDIATILDISTRTVRFHQGNVMRKLGVRSREALAGLLF